jgi:hypothetical protein
VLIHTLFLDTLRSLRTLDLKKTLGIDRLIVGRIAAVLAHLPRDGLHGWDLLQKLQRSARLTAHTLRNKRFCCHRLTSRKSFACLRQRKLVRYRSTSSISGGRF